MRDQTAIRFLNSMFDGTERVAILAIPRADPDARVEQRFTPAETAAGRTQAWLHDLNAQRYDIYLGVNPVREDSRQREKGDIAQVRRLQVDLDDNGPENLKRLLGDAARGVIPQPRHLLRSSKDHYQVLWDTARGQWSPDQAEATMRGIAARYGGDPACSEVARVMRWPGYRNQKQGRAGEMVRWIDPGRPPRHSGRLPGLARTRDGHGQRRAPRSRPRTPADAGAPQPHQSVGKGLGLGQGPAQGRGQPPPAPRGARPAAGRQGKAGRLRRTHRRQGNASRCQ